MSTQVLSPFPSFFDRAGKPLTLGYVYIGDENQDPQTHPKAVFWDIGLSSSASQPLITDSGYIVNGGNPSAVYTSGAFSIRVRDKNGVQVFYRASVPNFDALQEALTASSGSSLIGFIQSGTGAVSRTVQAKLRDLVSVKDFGAVGDGTTDDTAAIQAALDAHGNVYVPAGTYKVGTLNLGTRGSPDQSGLVLLGAGPGETIFVAKTANTPIFRKRQVAGVVELSTIGNFSLKAHSSGSTGPAFDCSGFRAVTFIKIFGLSNGSGAFASLFDVAAHPYLTYGCRWEDCGLQGQAGWARVWRTHNNGQGVSANPNACTIVNPWVYANTGMTVGIDLSNSTLFTVEGGLIESSGDYGITLGSRGNIFGVWFESQSVAPIQFQNTASVVSASNLLESCYFSGFSGNIPVPDGCAENTFENCPGAYTITPATAADNNILINSPFGGEATVAKTFGPSGTLTKISDTVVSSLDGTRRAVYTFQASSGAPTTAGFSVTPPSGYSTRVMSVSYYDAANGVPASASVDSSAAVVIVTVVNTNTYTLVIHYRYQ